MERTISILSAPTSVDAQASLDAGAALGGSARLVAYYTPTGTLAAIAVAVFATFRLSFGADHVAAHWWGIAIGVLVATAVTARGCARINGWVAAQSDEPDHHSR